MIYFFLINSKIYFNIFLNKNASFFLNHLNLMLNVMFLIFILGAKRIICKRNLIRFTSNFEKDQSCVHTNRRKEIGTPHKAPGSLQTK